MGLDKSCFALEDALHLYEGVRVTAQLDFTIPGKEEIRRASLEQQQQEVTWEVTPGERG